MTEEPQPIQRSTHADDSQMSRFEREGQDRFHARDAVGAIAIVALLLVLFAGNSVIGAAEEQEPGLERDVMREIGERTGPIADELPLDDVADDVTAPLDPDDDELGAEGGFGSAAATATEGAAPVTIDAFPSEALGEPAAPRPLDTVLVTGDSLSTPLDVSISKLFAPTGVEVVRDPHLATGISRSDLVDWGSLSTRQVAEHSPDAVVLFIGANEGYAMPTADGGTVECCGADYAAELATRMRQMLFTYRRGGETNVYWLTVPIARDRDRDVLADVVNSALRAAAAPYLRQVEIIDINPAFAPDGSYTDSIVVDGEEKIVRESDGIHLNPLGSELAAELVLERLDQDFDW